MDHDEFDVAAEKAARRAVKKTFAILGVNIDNPREVEEFRRDLRFAGDLRRNTNRGVWAIITTICGLIGTAIWLALAKYNLTWS